MIVTVVGLGLIGGSFALQLKKNGFATEVLGVESNEEHAKIAMERKLVDQVLPLSDGVKQADLVLITVSADATLKLLPTILDLVDQQVVMDVCSIKELICSKVESHSKRENFVASHPMAGTEYSGPNAALEGLYHGKTVVLVETEKSSEKALAIVNKMYQNLNMRIITMNAEEHDKHAAYVSHISHVSSMALALTVLEKEKNQKNIFDLAGGGFDSTVRLAKSSPEMWSYIFTNNSKNILAVLDEYIDQVNRFKNLIYNAKESEINGLIKSANKIEKILNNN